MNTTLINLIIKLKNAALSQKEFVIVDYNIFIIELLKLLYKEGFIQSFSIKLNQKQYQKKYEIFIFLRYVYNRPTLTNIKIFSTPSYNHFLKLKSIAKLSTKKKLFIFSTNKGLLSGLECKKYKLGGTLLFIC